MDVAALESTLVEIVGRPHVLSDPASRAAYETDWTRRFGSTSSLVVRPGSTEEVAATVRACAAAQLPIIAQGGNTGLVGGGVPRSGEVVISLRRLNQIDSVDPGAGRLSAGAGATLASVQHAARDVGLDFGIDMGSRDSATIGGLIATNAGGVRVVRHGPMRAQVRGIEAVLADGSIVSRLSGLAHDNGGYDLAGLLTGSEGTLGIITRAALRLIPLQGATAVALIGFGDTAAAMRVAAAARAAGQVEAVEIMYAAGVALVCKHTGLRPPLGGEHAVYLLVEFAGDNAAAQLEALLVTAEADDAAFATTPDERRRLWAYRERHPEAIAAEGVPHKLDVAVPAERMPEFIDSLAAVVARVAPAADGVVFGHLAVGNLHVNVLGPGSRDDQVADGVLRLVARLGGSVGAEHGIGVAKKRWLPLTRSAADIAAMRSLKRALDPMWLLNPGVLFDDDAG